MEGAPIEFRVGLKARVFNWSLDAAIKAKGLSRTDAAAALGIPLGTLFHYLSFKNYPKLEETRMRIGLALGVSDEVLFPESIRDVRIRKQPDPIALSADEWKEISGQDEHLALTEPEGMVEAELLKEHFAGLLSEFADRDRYVIEQRFGLAGGEEHTYAAIAQDIGVSTARIHQILRRALRKLRHPARSRVLRDFL